MSERKRRFYGFTNQGIKSKETRFNDPIFKLYNEDNQDILRIPAYSFESIPTKVL